MSRLLIVALAAALVGCAHGEPPASQEPAESSEKAPDGVVEMSAEAAKAMSLATTTAESRRVAVRQEVLGQITMRPEAEAVVHAPVTGQVVALHAKVGDRVAAGAPLMTIRSAERGAAQAEYLKALGLARLARKEQARQQALFAAELASKKELDEAAQAREAAELGLTQTGESLRVLGYGDAELAALARRGRVSVEQVLTAPRAGTVVERHVALGEMVGSDHEAPLFKLADLSVVRVEADLPERDFLAVKPGQAASVELAAMGQRQVTGRVAGLAPVMDPQSRTGRALIDVPNAQGLLRPGMSARVRIATGTREALVLPAAAVQEEPNGAYAYVPLGGDRYRETPIKLGARFDGGVEVTTGLSAGQTVVTKGSFDLRSQARKAQFGGD